jgi:hypothetical protein
MLSTLNDRTELIRLQYQAALILLECHPDSATLFAFFQDKVCLIQSFLYLLRTGPGSLDYCPGLIPLDIRLLACHCLEAIVGARDSPSSPMLVHYPWILHDLGVNRGQYMGLFPCLIRSSISYLISLEEKQAEHVSTLSAENEVQPMELVDNSNSVSAAIQVSKLDSHDDTTTAALDEHVEERLLWIEHVFLLLISLVGVSTALPTLTENGLVPSILMLLECKQSSLLRSDTLIFVEVLTIDILEAAISSHTTAMIAFRDKHGLEKISNRLLGELHYCRSMDKVKVSNDIIIQGLFNLLSTALQENRSGGDSSNDYQGQLYKNPALIQSYQMIFATPVLYGNSILSLAYSLLTELIQADPAPPTILSHILSTSVARDSLLVLHQCDDIYFSSDLVLYILGLLSAMSLTNEGIEVIIATNPFARLFSLFEQGKYTYPQSRMLMQDLPAQMGANVEELLRHYPAYMHLCMAELIATMKTILNRALNLLVQSTTNTNHPGAVCFSETYAILLNNTVSVLGCLEPLLLKKQTVVEFVRQDGIALLMQFLNVALGPPRYVMTSLGCTIDSTIHSIGYVPLIRVISSCCTHMSELEPKAVFDVIIVELEKTVHNLSAALNDPVLKAITNTNANTVTTVVTIEEGATTATATTPSFPPLSFPVRGLFSKVSSLPFQEYCSDGMLTPLLLQFSKALGSFTRLSYLLELLGITLQTSGTNTLSSITANDMKLCIAKLHSPEMIQLFRTIVFDVFIPCQQEIAQTRANTVMSTKSSCVKVHPLYHLLVITADGVVVKDSMEESAQKVCKLGRGCRTIAYERKIATATGLLKYRTKDGWVSVYRSPTNADPQFLVVDISKKSPDEYAEEVARNHDLYEFAERRSEFEKYASISARRSGFLSLNHFVNAVRNNVLCMLANHVYCRDLVPAGFSSQDQYMMTDFALSNITILLQCIKTAIPNDYSRNIDTTLDASKVSIDDVLRGLRSSSTQTPTMIEMEASSAATLPTTTTATLIATATTSSGRHSSSSSSSSTPLKFFNAKEYMDKCVLFEQMPTLAQFTTAHVYIAMRIADLSQMILFENRRGKLELNPFVLLHMMHGEFHVLEQVLSLSNTLYLCCFPCLELDVTDLPSHRSLYDGAWYPLREELVSDLEEVNIALTHNSNHQETTTAAADDNDNDGGRYRPVVGEASQALFPSYLSYRKALKERRLFSLSCLESIIDLWKHLCNSVCINAISSKEKALQREIDDTHSYDPYSVKRQVLMVLTKHLILVWNHPQIHLLPPCTVKSLLDLLAIIIKAIHELKQLGPRAPVGMVSKGSSANALSTDRSQAGTTTGSGGVSNLSSSEMRFMSGLMRSHSNTMGGSSTRPLLRSSQTSFRRGGFLAPSAAPTASSPVGTTAAAASTATTAAAASVDFVLNESTIRSLEDMGFMRRASIRAATLLRSNNVNQIVEYLFDNPYQDEGADAVAAPSARFGGAAVATVDAAVNSSNSNNNNNNSINSIHPNAINTSDAISQLMAFQAEMSSIGVNLQGFSSSMMASHNAAVAQRNAAIEASSSSSSSSSSDPLSGNVATTVKVNPLPLSAKPLEPDFKSEKEFLIRSLKVLYNSLPALFLLLIQSGPNLNFKTFDNDIKTANSAITRELFTVMLLNQTMRCLDRHAAPDSFVRIMELIWLYNRAVEVLEGVAVGVGGGGGEGDDLTVEKCSSLFGLLHGILVLLTSKNNISGPTTPRSTSSSTHNDLMYVIFTMDSRFNKLYGLLVRALESTSNNLLAAAIPSSSSNHETVDIRRLEWIAPAVLIIDIVIQPFLIDAPILKDAILEMDHFLHRNPHIISSELAVGDYATEETFLSDSLKEKIYAKFFNEPYVVKHHHHHHYKGGKKSNKESSTTAVVVEKAASAILADGSTAATTSATTSAVSQDNSKDMALLQQQQLPPLPPLPLYEECMTFSQKETCLQLCLNLIGLSSDRHACLYVAIPQATMQLLAHLTRNSTIRTQFHDLHGGLLVLRCNCSFEGMSSVIFTLLQQVLEDEKHLVQSITTAIRLCYLRLSKQKTSMVPFKNFIEVVCPVIFRDQSTFMKILQSCMRIKFVNGQSFLELKDSSSSSSSSSSNSSVAVAGALNANDGKSTSTAASHPADQQQQQHQVSMSTEENLDTMLLRNSEKKQRTGIADGSIVNIMSSEQQQPQSPPVVSSTRLLTKRGYSEYNASSSEPNSSSSSSSSSSSKHVSSSQSSSVSSNSSVHAVVDEIICLIFVKWLKIKSIGLKDDWNSPESFISSSLSIADLLTILADLIASLPAVAVCVHRYYINPTKAPAWAVPCLEQEFPIKHILSGQIVGNQFITFVIHYLMLPGRLQTAEKRSTTSEMMLAINKLSGEPIAGSTTLQSSQQTSGNLHDACCYFIASLSSRPGEGRKRVLNDLLNAANKGIGNIDLISATKQIRAIIRLGESLQYLLNPPPRWALRDAFVLPAKDILVSLAKLKAHTRLSAVVCLIDLKHPLSLEASIALSIPIDTIIRKGIDEMNNVIDTSHTTVCKANHPASSSSIIPSHTSSIENQTSALTVHHHQPTDRNANNTHVFVTSPDHTSNTSSAVIPNDELILQANLSTTNTTTAANDRPSVVTFQEQIFSTPVVNARGHVDSSDHYTDEADRLLLTAGSDFLNSSSQHQHLMLPSQHNHYAERNDDSSDDDEGPRNTNEIGEEGFEDHEDGDVSEMMT